MPAVKLKHIEVEGCIVNIREGLTDMRGRRVTSVEIIPDEMYGWKLIGTPNNRVIQLKKSGGEGKILPFK